jgi:hypothetical protein
MKLRETKKREPKPPFSARIQEKVFGLSAPFLTMCCSQEISMKLLKESTLNTKGDPGSTILSTILYKVAVEISGACCPRRTRYIKVAIIAMNGTIMCRSTPTVDSARQIKYVVSARRTPGNNSSLRGIADIRPISHLPIHIPLRRRVSAASRSSKVSNLLVA